MQMWFSEYHTVNVKLDVRIEEQLFSGKSEYQKIDVFKSYEFGKMAALDGEIVFSDADEFIYDEMVTHVPMAVHPNAKKILIIGGGDGGVAKELIKYPFVEKIDVVETDKMFVDVCRKFFPEVACGLEDPRISMYCPASKIEKAKPGRVNSPTEAPRPLSVVITFSSPLTVCTCFQSTHGAVCFSTSICSLPY